MPIVSPLGYDAPQARHRRRLTVPPHAQRRSLPTALATGAPCAYAARSTARVWQHTDERGVQACGIVITVA